MDFFYDVLMNFLKHQRFGGQGQKSLRFVKNVLICVSKINRNLKGLEQHEGDSKIFIFFGELSLQESKLCLMH